MPQFDDVPRVLVIEDDGIMQRLLQAFLEKEGYAVDLATNGQEGVAAFQRQPPDMVLLDAKMPVMDGFECCAQIQTLPDAEHSPVLMITGLEDRQSVDRAFAVGAADYVTKPIHWPVLRQRVQRLILQARLQRQLQAKTEQLQRLAFIDELTQVGNRRQFDEYLYREWGRLQREQQCLGLILCDVDFFKPYNDHYGHPAGDRCLQKVAEAIRSAVRRSSDLVARYGGEEFAVLLSNTTLAGARQVAEAICDRIRDLQIPHAYSSISDYISLSLGVTAGVPTKQGSRKGFVKTADDALYAAKEGGRNRIVAYPYQS